MQLSKASRRLCDTLQSMQPSAAKQGESGIVAHLADISLLGVCTFVRAAKGAAYQPEDEQVGVINSKRYLHAVWLSADGGARCHHRRSPG